MSHFDEVKRLVDDGMDGRNSGIPMGFNRLNNHISIRKSTYYLIGGYTGSGKTSLVDDAFVLNPLDWWIRNKDVDKPDLHIIYFSMERPKNFKLAKWICRAIFLMTGHIIPVNRMLGWVNKEIRLNAEEYAYFMACEEYIEAIMTKIDIISGPLNPTGKRKYIDAYAEANGELDASDKYKVKYTPKDPNKITEIITDTIGLHKLEEKLPTKKQSIDKASEDNQKFRDLYGFSPIDVSQFNRDIANPMRIKNGDVEPMLEDFKETGSTQENADVVISLFDPMRYKVPDPSGYELDRLRDDSGRKKYRNAKILKNSYGSDDVRIGLAFQPEIGLFKEMPKFPKGQYSIPQEVYDSIIDNTYFLPEN